MMFYILKEDKEKKKTQEKVLQLGPLFSLIKES